ncbi:MAG: carbon-nitrogen hydrolase family protein [Actinobacteria bacterium]|nr:carbon-nitrogen hydrolase family protein [Actinomycetota bacterium]
MKIQISVCQMSVFHDKKANLVKAKDFIINAAAAGSKIIVLPEMFNCPYENSFFKKFAEEFPGPTTDLISSLAKDLSIYIIGGSIPEKENGKIYNTSYTFNPEGLLIGKHRKVHLFDVDISGRIKFKESDTLSYGDNVTVFETKYCKIGVAICYDMRFCELMRKMTLLGAKIIAIPASFNMITGPAHWHLLARTRALDNQVYFIAASPARNEKDIYVSYGHSLIVDPWGKIIAEKDEKEGLLHCEIDLDYVEQIRNQLPILKHSRLFLNAK